jgi:CspA family cold shock protein
MPVGTVTWYSATKGFGFILPDAGVPYVLVHISAVEQAGLHQLDVGQKIGFDLKHERRGKTSAVNLKLASAGNPVLQENSL